MDRWIVESAFSGLATISRTIEIMRLLSSRDTIVAMIQGT